MEIQCKLCGRGGNTKCMDVSAGPTCKILVRLMSLIFKLQLPVKARYYRYCRYQTNLSNIDQYWQIQIKGISKKGQYKIILDLKIFLA